MNLDDFSYEEDGRRYINPQVSLDEQNAFINNLRSVQEKNNAEIVQDTSNLGTDVPSNLGGLVGGESYFQSRYQTPQTNALVADLRATAQAQALNTAMKNELDIAKKRYSNAYKAAQKRAALNNTPGNVQDDDDLPNVEYEDNDSWEEAVAGSSEFAGSQLTAEQLAKMNQQNKKESGGINAGGSAVNPTQKIFVDGREAVVTKSLYGPVLDTGMFSIQGSSNIADYLGGRKITDEGGHDMSSTYRLVLGLH